MAQMRRERNQVPCQPFLLGRRCVPFSSRTRFSSVSDTNYASILIVIIFNCFPHLCQQSSGQKLARNLQETKSIEPGLDSGGGQRASRCQRSASRSVLLMNNSVNFNGDELIMLADIFHTMLL